MLSPILASWTVLQQMVDVADPHGRDLDVKGSLTQERQGIFMRGQEIGCLANGETAGRLLADFGLACKRCCRLLLLASMNKMSAQRGQDRCNQRRYFCLTQGAWAAVLAWDMQMSFYRAALQMRCWRESGLLCADVKLSNMRCVAQSK